MTTWLVPKKAATYIKEQNPSTMIGERTIRTLIKNGFPHLQIDSRCLINVDTFDFDMIEYLKLQQSKYSKQVNSPIRKIKAS